jgi:ubiquinone/menaquinone biosynthesis C-methylase UbiE
MSIADKKDYYKKVQEYYNEDSYNFEDRYWENETLQRIRNSFREETDISVGSTVLEIGYGPGLDLIYFAKNNPKSRFYGVDISDGMFRHAQKQADKDNIDNLELEVGSFEDVENLFPDQKFDLIYVYFGALNTVENIEEVQFALKKILNPKGKLVLTFVNKWYLMSIIKPMLKFKFSVATKRLGKVWGGYSPNKFLESRCYTSQEIIAFFSEFNLDYKRGYSILFPAWYENHIYKKYPKRCERLWKIDQFLQKTTCWNFGEYSLYIFSL